MVPTHLNYSALPTPVTMRDRRTFAGFWSRNSFIYMLSGIAILLATALVVKTCISGPRPATSSADGKTKLYGVGQMSSTGSQSWNCMGDPANWPREIFSVCCESSGNPQGCRSMHRHGAVSSYTAGSYVGDSASYNAGTYHSGRYDGVHQHVADYPMYGDVTGDSPYQDTDYYSHFDHYNGEEFHHQETIDCTVIKDDDSVEKLEICCQHARSGCDQLAAKKAQKKRPEEEMKLGKKEEVEKKEEDKTEKKEEKSEEKKKEQTEAKADEKEEEKPEEKKEEKAAPEPNKTPSVPGMLIRDAPAPPKPSSLATPKPQAVAAQSSSEEAVTGAVPKAQKPEAEKPKADENKPKEVEAEKPKAESKKVEAETKKAESKEVEAEKPNAESKKVEAETKKAESKKAEAEKPKAELKNSEAEELKADEKKPEEANAEKPKAEENERTAEAEKKDEASWFSSQTQEVWPAFN